jgi:hypothetical protein
MSRTLARCTTAAAAGAQSPPPAERGERRDPPRSPGRREGFEAERRRERWSSDPSTSWGARWEVTESTRHRKAWSRRRPNACVGGSPVGDGATATGLLERPRPDAYRGRPWRRAREMSAGTNTESFDGGRSRLSRRRSEREECRSRVYSTRMARRRRDSLPTPRPWFGRQTESRRAIGERTRSPGYLAPRSLPLRSTRVRLRSPAQDPWRGIRESLPARPIVTASRIGPMPERMSLNLIDSSPITIAVPTSPRDAHSQAPSPRGTPRSPGRGRGPSGLPGAQRRRVQSMNQSANHSGARSGTHS